jgi:hypothetical protein
MLRPARWPDRINLPLHCATERSLLRSGKGLEAGGGTFAGAVSISRTVVLTAVRISRSVNAASRSTGTAWHRKAILMDWLRHFVSVLDSGVLDPRLARSSSSWSSASGIAPVDPESSASFEG